MDREFASELTIAVCDNDLINQQMLTFLLEKKNFRSVLGFSSPKEVLDIFETGSEGVLPNIIIMDTDTDAGSISSIETTEVIKNNSPDVIIICISSSSKESQDVSLRALASGCDSWVDKDKKDYLGRLMARVSYWITYLEEHKKLAELYSSLGGLDQSEV